MNTSSSPSLPAYSGMALHRQLFLILRERLLGGAWARGEAMPTEAALCVQFGVSRITVRRALDDLVTQGLVERRRGVGTFAAAPTETPVPRGTLSFVDTLRRSAVETTVQVLGVEHVRPPAEVVALLKLEPAEKALHALRLRMLDGRPVLYTEAWIPERLGRNVTRAALKKNAMYEVLIAQGVKFGRVVQEMAAQISDLRLAQHLQTEPGSALLKITRLMHDVDSRPIQYLTAYLPPERSRVLMDIPGDEVNTLSAGLIVHNQAGISAQKG